MSTFTLHPPSEDAGSVSGVAQALGGAAAQGEAWRDRYQTPEGIRRVVRRIVGYPTIDVAALAHNRFGSTYCGPDTHDPKHRDGLVADWTQVVVELPFAAGERGWPDPRCVAWCNPPYSDVARWMFRCSNYGALMTVVALVFERRETAWWRHYVQPCACQVVTLYPRVNFIDPRTQKPAEGGGSALHSCLVIWRPGFEGPPASSHANWRDDAFLQPELTLEGLP